MNRLNLVLIIFSLIMVLVKIASDPLLTTYGILLSWSIIIEYLILFVFLFILVLFILRLASRDDNKIHRILYFCFALLISSLFISLIGFMPDDEIILAYFAYHSIILGVNPYAQNYTALLLPVLHTMGAYGTITATGGTIATYNYPALYMLVQAPFFALQPPVIDLNGFVNPALTLGYWVMPVEYMVFFGIFLYVYFQIVKTKKSEYPIYSAIVLATIAFLVFSSTIIILMLALMLGMYTEWGKKPVPSGILLGLMASIQTQLWPFALIFLVYKLNTERYSDGMRVLTSSIMTFLLFNGVFILLSPSAFFGNLVSAGNLLPDYISPIGSLLLIAGVPASVLSIVFVLITVLVALLCMDLDPYWFPLMSAIPFLFLAHALPIYYMLPFAVFALLQDDKNDRESR